MLLRVSTLQSILIILTMGIATFITRAFPFIVFSKNKNSSYINYIGKVLPPAVIGMLIIYCVKNVNIFEFPYGLSEILSIVSVILLHVWKRNNLLSILGGTIIYMILVQKIII